METRNISGYCLTAGKTGATEYASQHLWEIAFPENIVAVRPCPCARACIPQMRSAQSRPQANMRDG